MDVSQLGYRLNVGIMVLNAQGLIWIGQRHDAPADPEGPGSWWQMPQGGIDEGETPTVAALRELREETGMHTVALLGASADWLTYDLPPALVGKAWGGRYRGQRQKWIAVRFDGEESEIDIKPQPGHPPEFVAWRWAHAAELQSLIVPFKREVYAHVLDEFKELISAR